MQRARRTDKNVGNAFMNRNSPQDIPYEIITWDHSIDTLLKLSIFVKSIKALKVGMNT